MMRERPNSGEIYDPRTVLDRMDLTTASRIVMPLLIDVVDRKVIWADMAMRNNMRRVNNVWGNHTTLGLIMASIMGAAKPDLYQLVALHVQARGELVTTPEEADISFTVVDGFPFRHEEIASVFLA